MTREHMRFHNGRLNPPNVLKPKPRIIELTITIVTADRPSFLILRAGAGRLVGITTTRPTVIATVLIGEGLVTPSTYLKEELTAMPTTNIGQHLAPRVVLHRA